MWVKHWFTYTDHETLKQIDKERGPDISWDLITPLMLGPKGDIDSWSLKLMIWYLFSS